MGYLKTFNDENNKTDKIISLTTKNVLPKDFQNTETN